MKSIEQLMSEIGDLRLAVADNARLRELLKEVSYSGVELDDPRMGYVIIQIDPKTWAEVKALAATQEGPQPMTEMDHAYMGLKADNARLQDQVAALRERIEAAGRLLLSVRGDGGYPRLKCYWCHEGFGGAAHAEDCPYDAWLRIKG